MSIRSLRLLRLLAWLPLLAGTAAAQTAPAPPGPEVLALREDLREIVRAPAASRYGVLVVSLERGDTLFSLNPDETLAPASNLKLFSTAAALYYLGPDFRFSTYLLTHGPIRDGALLGDLVLYGTGDPSLSGRMLESASAPFRALADSLRALGVNRVTGDLIGDGTWFDAEWRGTDWNPGDLLAWYAAPVGALSFAENMVGIQVLPGEAGEPALIRTSPATVGLAVENRVRTVSRGATSVRFENGRTGLVITGQVRRGGAGVSRTVPVGDPNNFAAAALRAILRERGIEVEGRTRTIRSAGESPVTLALGAAAGAGAAPRVLAMHRSPPLEALARVTNHVSHNLFADALLKTVGRVALGEGSFAGGGRAVEGFLEREAGIHPDALHLVDGSGLSRSNRVSARATIALLDFMTRGGAWGPYLASLPQAGSQRGLRRMYSTPAAGNLRAKTGTIRRVSALSGYVHSADGELLAFSILANEVPSTARAKQVEDAIGARIARFRRSGSARVAPDQGPGR